MSGAGAVAALLDPASKADLKVTIPEGFTVKEAKERLKNVDQFNPDEVEKAFAEVAKSKLPKVAKGNLEGWLAPDTYTVTPGTEPADVLETMVDATISKLKDHKVPEEKWEEVMTKASILENEVNVLPDGRPCHRESPCGWELGYGRKTRHGLHRTVWRW